MHIVGGVGLWHGLVGLLERDVDDVVLFLAERVHVDIADQRDLDGGRIGIGALVDRGDVGRRRDLGVRQVERQHAVEEQRELLFVQHRRDADAVRHLKHEPNEGRLHQRADPDRRLLPGSLGGALHAQQAFGRARPLRQFADDFLRQRRRRAGPAVREKVDEDALAGGHGVDGHPA